MVKSCWVNGCKNRSDPSVKRGFFLIPKVNVHHGEQTKVLCEERRRAWLSSINRKDPPSMWSRICSDHFISGSPASLYDRTNPDWLPTLLLSGSLSPKESQRKKKLTDTELKRYNRSVDRNKVKNKHSAARALIELSSEPAAAAHGSTEDEDSLLVSEINFNADDEQNGDQNLDLESTCDTEVESLRRENIKLKEQLENAKCSGAADSEMQRLLSENMLLKEQINNLKFNEDSFKDQDEKVRYYTGLPGYVTLMALFSFVRGFIPKPKANSELGQFERLLITLMRLKLNFPVQDLAFRFRTSAPTISRTFTSVIHVLYVRLKHLLYWPDRDELHETMPLEFRKHFGKQTAVIIDCFEVFIQRPRNMLARAQTWSSYKHSNTVKFLIGITPQGSISFLSKAWGGRASDKWITENCGILKKLLPGDLVLADRGFDIAESVGICCAQINIPAFTKGKSQLSPVDIETTRKIASVRIHVERVIGLVRNKYTMLQSRLPVDYLLSDNELPVIDKIAVVACALSNMCPSVVPFN